MVKVLGHEDPGMRYSAVNLFCQSDNVLLAPTPEHTSPSQALSRLFCSRRSQGQKRKLQFDKKTCSGENTANVPPSCCESSCITSSECNCHAVSACQERTAV